MESSVGSGFNICILSDTLGGILILKWSTYIDKSGWRHFRLKWFELDVVNYMKTLLRAWDC